MNAREKRLAQITGGVVVLFGGAFLLHQVMVKPVRAAAKSADGLENQVREFRKERRAFFAAEDELRELTRRTFADDANVASAESGELLTRLIEASGLKETKISRLPFGPQIPRGAREIGWELGWNIQGVGPLDDVISFLYLLQKSPQLHRLENVVVSAGNEAGEVKLRLKYMTLLLKATPEVERTNDMSWVSLDVPERAHYAVIAERDVLSPFVEPPPPPPSPNPPSPAPAAPSLPPGPETFRVVSLSEWKGEPEVHVLDMTANETRSYKPGDELAGGVIWRVDYRALPKRGEEPLLSHSRVILKVAEEYWAVERGHTLAQKYRLKPDQLPGADLLR